LGILNWTQRGKRLIQGSSASRSKWAVKFKQKLATVSGRTTY
jgi:hypothetical protein